MTHEAVSRRVYFLVFAALLALTALTVIVTFFELGRFNLVIALLIAGTKATLVVWFFMHLRQSSPLTRIFIASGILFFLILIAFTFSDYISRTWLPTPTGW
jgi:cytochrome c oxidase subunit IV